MERRLWLIILLMSGIASASCPDPMPEGMRLCEDFEDQLIDSRLMPRVVSDGLDPVSPPRYAFTDPGRGGRGYSFASGTAHDPFLEWRYANAWYTNEFYVSFWLRYPSYVPDSDGHWNIKTFYPHWNGASSYVCYSATGKGYFLYASSARGQSLENSDYIAIPEDFDGNWHHYEFYVQFDGMISRFWYDGVLKRDYDFDEDIYDWTNELNYLTFGAEDSTTGNVFTREIDDIEVWDRMPGQNISCIGDCSGKECGPDSCGGSCGSCQGQYACHSGLCCHKSDTDLDGCVEDPELIAFIGRWKASSTDASMMELLEAIKTWKEGCG